MHIRKVFIGVAAIILLVGLLVAVVGCGGPKPTESPLPSPSSPFSTPSRFESPIETPTTQSSEISGPTFAIDRPLKAGATNITGQGPAGIPIVVVDVTMTGQELGQGFIDDTGRFDIELNRPLEHDHRIGLMAGAAQAMSPEEIQVYIKQLLRWKGEGARDLPYIGMLFDTTMVEQ